MIPYFQVPSLHLGPIAIEPFGILVSLGFIMGTSLSARRARIVGLEEKAMYDLGLLTIVFGLVGAHLMHVFLYEPRELMRRPIWLFQVWSGISSDGGLIGAGLAIYFYLKTRRLPFFPYADAIMFGLFPGWFLGRVGCAITHDHPGHLTNFFLAVQYPGGARHNLGLYEALLFLLLIIPLTYFLGRKKNVNDPRPGSIYSTLLIAYGAARFLLDFLRAKDVPHSDARYGGLTPAQYLCFVCVGLGFYLFARIRQSDRT